MSDYFACLRCSAVYAITRSPQPPAKQPSCEVCGNKFPPSELGEWLTYQRAEPEWTVRAWLTGALEVEESVSQADTLPNPAVKVEDTATDTGASETLTSKVRKIAALIRHS